MSYEYYELRNILCGSLSWECRMGLFQREIVLKDLFNNIGNVFLYFTCCKNELWWFLISYRYNELRNILCGFLSWECRILYVRNIVLKDLFKNIGNVFFYFICCKNELWWFLMSYVYEFNELQNPFKKWRSKSIIGDCYSF